jgi:hypothetical protein
MLNKVGGPQLLCLTLDLTELESGLKLRLTI